MGFGASDSLDGAGGPEDADAHEGGSMTSTLDPTRPEAGRGPEPGLPAGLVPVARLATGATTAAGNTTAAEAWLSYVDGQGRPRRVELTDAPPRLTVGRSSAGVDVSLPDDAQVSRLHAVLEYIGGQWTVEDDGLSRNGTFVNEVRVTGRARLRDRDRLRVGRTVLTYCCPGPGSDPRTVAGDALPARRRLTPAQRAVLVALCRPCTQGRPCTEGGPHPVPATNAEIAAELVLSVEAVKTHLRALFHTFGIESLPQNAKRARLVELAMAFGLATDDGR